MPPTNTRAVLLVCALAQAALTASCADPARGSAQVRDADVGSEGGSAPDSTPAPEAAAASQDSAPDPGDAASAPDGGGFAIAALPSEGCGATGESTYPPGTTVAQRVHAGVTRSFRVHVPPDYDAARPAPLVLMLHGGGGSGRQFEEASSDMDPVADREGFVAVYPDGTGVLRTWNGGGCCGAGVQNDVDDVGFIAALLVQLDKELCLDQRRTFATGMSNGGIFAHRLACELSERIAAIAPVAGTDNTASCVPTRPVSVMQIHGTADGHVPWQGGEGCGPAGVAFTSVPDTITRWQARNRCDERSELYHAEGDGRCDRLTGCADGAEVVLCAIEGGGHNWPGGQPPAGLIACPGNGGQSSTFSASEVAWRFFADHPLPAR